MTAREYRLAREKLGKRMQKAEVPEDTKFVLMKDRGEQK
jgi:hypothetical protein